MTEQDPFRAPDLAATSTIVTSSKSFSIEAGDTSAPAVNWNADGTKLPNIAASANIVVTFNENIVAGSGTLVLRDEFGNEILREPVPGPRVTIAGNTLILNPGTDLQPMRHYILDIAPGSVRDAAGNAFAGDYWLGFQTFALSNPVQVRGTTADEVIEGGDANDILHGGAGSDQVWGHAGDDILYSGDAFVDGQLALQTQSGSLHGGAGNDTLYGDSGSDLLDGGAGDDRLEGGAGDDELRDNGGTNILRGGYGNDFLLSTFPATSVLDGGFGNDLLQGNQGDTFIGGAGDDTIRIDLGFYFQDGAAVTAANGGDGNDSFEIAHLGDFTSEAKLTGGAGMDTYVVSAQRKGSFTVTDFTPGHGGDLIDISALLAAAPENASAATEPQFRLIQDGADTLLQAIDAGSFQTLIRLQGLQRTQLVSSNLNTELFTADRTDGATIMGTDGSDTIDGASLGLQSNARNDTVDGGAGIDVAMIDGPSSNFTVSRDGNVATVTGKDGSTETDTYVNIERIAFDDTAIALDVGADRTAGQVYRLYQAAFNRTPDSEGVGFWIGVADADMQLGQIATQFMQSAEFASLYGASPDNETLVRLLYVNALHRQPDAPGVAYWTNVLDQQHATRAEVLVGFSESAENQAVVAEVIGNGFKFTPWL